MAFCSEAADIPMLLSVVHFACAFLRPGCLKVVLELPGLHLFVAGAADVRAETTDGLLDVGGAADRIRPISADVVEHVAHLLVFVLLPQWQEAAHATTRDSDQMRA